MTAKGSPLERFLVGAARLATGSTLHPIAVLQAVETAARVSRSEDTLANAYLVKLNPEDAGNMSPGLDTLRTVIETMLTEFRTSSGADVLSAWTVAFAASSAVQVGTVEVEATFRHEPPSVAKPGSTKNTESVMRHPGKFIIVDGLARVRLSHTPFLIGRGPSCDLVLADLSVSRMHARIEHTSTGHLFVRDLGSRNRLSVDGETVDLVQLSPDVKVTIGATTIWLEAET